MQAEAEAPEPTFALGGLRLEHRNDEDEDEGEGEEEECYQEGRGQVFGQEVSNPCSNMFSCRRTNDLL